MRNMPKKNGLSVPSFLIRLLGSGKAGDAAKKLAAAKKKKQAALDKVAKDL
jgi:hypothetical protein